MTTNQNNPRADSDGQAEHMADAFLDPRLGEVEAMLGQVGADERSMVTPAMLDRIAGATWQGAMPSSMPALRFEGWAVGTGAVGTGSVGWGRSLRMAAAVAIIGTIAAGIVAVRSSPATGGATGNQIAKNGSDRVAPVDSGNDVVLATTATDPDLALIDALWSDDSSSTDDLWADAGSMDTSSDVTVDQLLGGGTTESTQGGAM